ncbi:hypothetical protein [Janthinobacterium lividum]|uniref:hypothetical protein n=1 Tax=Janthinobacterium lividum TaxID=29581 RepID=UPI001114CDE4|nr:hypothetical protein [Janthinobacterium lividum]
MDFLSSLPKILMDLALGLFKIKKDDRTRQRLADLLSSVADCVDGIANAVENGIHSSSLCAELDAYIENIEAFVQDEIGNDQGRRLTLWLRHVGSVPGIAKIDVRETLEVTSRPRWSKRKRLEHADSIREIGGLIRGTANLVRV